MWRLGRKTVLTEKEATALIDYIETMEEHTNHQNNMIDFTHKGWTEQELDEACIALGKIAGRNYGIL